MLQLENMCSYWLFQQKVLEHLLLDCSQKIAAIKDLLSFEMQILMPSYWTTTLTRISNIQTLTNANHWATAIFAIVIFMSKILNNAFRKVKAAGLVFLNCFNTFWHSTLCTIYSVECYVRYLCVPFLLVNYIFAVLSMASQLGIHCLLPNYDKYVAKNHRGAAYTSRYTWYIWTPNFGD